MDDTQQRKTILIVVTLFAVLIIGLLVYFSVLSFSRHGKVALNIDVLPTYAKVTLNNKPVSNGSIYVKPGQYTLQASASGYTADSRQTSVKKGQAAIVTLALYPETAAASQWYDDHQQLYNELQTKAGQQYADSSTAFSNKNPITDDLPFENLLYSVGYQRDPDNNANIIITIDAADGYRNAAVEKIRDLGYDPADYKISFSDYVNPFGGTQ